MKIQIPNYTQVPNCILDAISELKESELKLLLFVCRQTFGYHVESRLLRTKQLLEGTGLASASLTEAIQSCIEKDLIEREGVENSRGGFSYSLKFVSNSETMTVSKFEKVSDATVSKSETVESDAICSTKEISTIKKDSERSRTLKETAKRVLAEVNRLSGRSFRETDANLEPICARLTEKGVDEEGVFQMLSRQWLKWENSEWQEYFRPSTLFRRSKFDDYYTARDLPIITKTQKHIRGLNI